MILYLVASTLCMALLLLVYCFFLEKEKMHRFNRAYLLFSLVFSLAIPLIPIGMAGNLNGWGISDPSAAVESVHDGPAAGAESAVYDHGEIAGLPASGKVFKAVLILFGLITLILFIRFICNIDSILFKVRRHTCIPYGNAVIVLLKEKTIPFSFLSYIFLNEQSYREGRIKKEVLIHESTHVCQKHTLDILFIELLKTLFWFNPVLYFYKRAIQLNHEFLADQAVVSHTDKISPYQSMLLRTTLSQPRCALTSNFNFSMTKKRLMMMTHKTSRTRSLVKQLTILPVLAGAALLFGCQVTESDPEERPTDQIVTIEVTDSEMIKLNGRMIDISILDDQLAALTQTSDLIVNLRVQPDAYVGTIWDVQKIVRDYSLRVNYSTGQSKSGNKKDDLDRAIERFTDAVKQYFQMPVRETSTEDLQKKYDQVMDWYRAIDEKQIEYYRDKTDLAPPPPPLPPNPERRLEME